MEKTYIKNGNTGAVITGVNRRNVVSIASLPGRLNLLNQQLTRIQENIEALEADILGFQTAEIVPEEDL